MPDSGSGDRRVATVVRCAYLRIRISTLSNGEAKRGAGWSDEWPSLFAVLMRKSNLALWTTTKPNEEPGEEISEKIDF